MLELKARLKCKDFDWCLKNVYPELQYVFKPVKNYRAKNTGTVAVKKHVTFWTHVLSADFYHVY